MTGRQGWVPGRSTAVIATLIAALGIALIAAGSGVAGKGANKTYGLTGKTKKNGTFQSLALKKPGKVTFKDSFDFYKAKKIGKWKGWGSDEVSAKARNVKLCDLEGKKKTDCSSAKGTVSFEDPAKRRCKIKKRGKRKKVTLYRTTVFEHGPTGEWPNGRGAGVQFATLSEKPPCPKF